jgi:hypothetical protein
MGDLVMFWQLANISKLQLGQDIGRILIRLEKAVNRETLSQELKWQPEIYQPILS